MNIAVISITKNGDNLAKKIGEKFNIHLFSKNLSKDFNFKEVVRNSFENYEAVVFITSTGIAVRSIAPYITTKDKDPAVIVIDNLGKFVISLLSGHLGGANKITKDIALILRAEPIITTATDNLGIIAPDMIAKENNLIIDSLKNAKDIAALLVDEKEVGFLDEEELISCPSGYVSKLRQCDGVVYVTNKNVLECIEQKKIPKRLKLIRRNIILGIGCRKDYPMDSMKEKVLEVLKEQNIDARAIKCIATVEVKKDERAIIELSKYLDCDIKIFTIEEIKKVQHKYEGSAFVEKTLGITSVCEPSIELAGGTVEISKMKLDGMTLAIGKEV
ncbi:cobalt-precorrin 5A hydrolase [Clostridium pascui]|uniref:cobalt-precorrin 5A hydrolase n=1 Tax=Clostridium pascui TaxID=46609 RepID=UPI00195A39D6|nr:cobalt-precorrin 5A hydrolase [Clostridium pascui]MBM7870825.1 cobalt-precorrin 5A hydrolase [Clostridium pascui]